MRAEPGIQECIHGRMERDGHNVTVQCDMDGCNANYAKKKRKGKKLGSGITSSTELEMMI
jgi:hypothetical protein